MITITIKQADGQTVTRVFDTIAAALAYLASLEPHPWSPAQEADRYLGQARS
jgi:hypothetical protein